MSMGETKDMKIYIKSLMPTSACREFELIGSTSVSARFCILLPNV
jgi:hypothetical protein